MKYSRKWLAKEWINSQETRAHNPVVFLARKQSKSIGIEDLKIDGNIITAKSKAQYSDYFDVKLTFKKFSEKDKQTIADVILDDDFILSEILNYQLPYELYEKLSENGVKLFPDKFNHSCNCLNRAEYCPHVLSLIYNVFLLFSKNPFLFFEVHDCNLFELIGYDLKVKTIDDVLNVTQKVDAVDKVPVIEDMISTNLMMLQDNPVFYDGDFKSVFYDMCREMGDYTRYLNRDEYVDYVVLALSFQFVDDSNSKKNNDEKFSSKWLNPDKWDGLTINIDENYGVSDINTFNDNNPFSISNLNLAIFGFLSELKYDDDSVFNDNINFLYSLYSFTLRLIASHAIIPELFQLSNGLYNIRWIPAIFNRNIRRNCEKFYHDCPDDLVTYNGERLSKKSQVLVAVSLIVSGFLKYFLKNGASRELKYLSNDDVFKLFYSKSLDLNDIDSINNWLSNFSLNSHDYSIYLVIKNHGSKYSMEVEITPETENNLQIKKDIYIINKMLSLYSSSIKIDKKGYFNSDTLQFIYENFVPAMERMGVEVRLPDDLNEILKPELVLEYEGSDKNLLSLSQISDFNWKIAIGDDYYPLDEFEKLTKKYNGLVKLNSRYAYFDTQEIKKIFTKIDNFDNLNPSRVMQSVLTSEFDYYHINVDKKLKELINNLTIIEDIEVPESLNATLRPYQKTGYAWLSQNIKTGFGSILADDMGLGKTIQVLTTILHLKEDNQLKGQVLVIAPTSLLTNWQKEIEKFTPTLTSAIYHGPGRELNEEADIILTSYGVARYDADNFENIDILVIDEAQNIKNTQTKQTKAIKKIIANHKIALSGTPIENRLSEYWSIFDFTNRGYLSGLSKFKKKYINPIEKSHDERALDNFKKITAPFILRRQKSDENIVKELPEKNVNDIYCNLTEKQVGLYQANLDLLMGDIEGNEGIGRKGMVLKLINSLKQICNHPSQFLKSSKATIEESGKMEVLMSILENILDADEKVLIFTQYVQMGEIIQKLAFEKLKTEVLFYRGSLTPKQRDKLVDEFQNGDAQIMIVSLKAGGMGLNLTAAKNVIHYDLWWNPAVENQATDRTHRIGQTKDIMVYRFITKGTFEENIDKMLKQKQELANMAITSNEKFITEMSDDELKEMLNLRRF